MSLMRGFSDQKSNGVVARQHGETQNLAAKASNFFRRAPSMDPSTDIKSGSSSSVNSAPLSRLPSTSAQTSGQPGRSARPVQSNQPNQSNPPNQSNSQKPPLGKDSGMTKQQMQSLAASLAMFGQVLKPEHIQKDLQKRSGGSGVSGGPVASSKSTHSSADHTSGALSDVKPVPEIMEYSRVSALCASLTQTLVEKQLAFRQEQESRRQAILEFRDDLKRQRKLQELEDAAIHAAMVQSEQMALRAKMNQQKKQQNQSQPDSADFLPYRTAPHFSPFANPIDNFPEFDDPVQGTSFNSDSIVESMAKLQASEKKHPSLSVQGQITPKVHSETDPDQRYTGASGLLSISKRHEKLLSQEQASQSTDPTNIAQTTSLTSKYQALNQESKQARSASSRPNSLLEDPRNLNSSEKEY